MTRYIPTIEEGKQLGGEAQGKEELKMKKLF